MYASLPAMGDILPALSLCVLLALSAADYQDFLTYYGSLNERSPIVLGL